MAVGRCESTPLTLSSLNGYELANALRFAEFRKGIAPGAAAVYWSQFEADLAGWAVDFTGLQYGQYCG
jgi:hypothetical protein